LRRPTNGTLLALAFAAVLVLGIALVAVYKARESNLPAQRATFRLLPEAPANATVHELDFRAVHTRDSFLEDHLDTAVQRGSSSESERLRVQQMRDTLGQLTGTTQSPMLVRWGGHVVQVDFSG
jgi:hypothetical protein